MLLDDLAGYLATASLGTVGSTIFKSLLPDKPDAALALFQYSGEPPVFEHDSPLPVLRYPRLQVLVRDASYAAAMTKAEAAYNALAAILNQTINGTTYLRVAPLNEPSALPRDESQRSLIVCNYRVTH